MAKLTDSQRIVLSAAAAREDGLAVPPTKMAKAAAAKVGASLVGRKLMREMRARAGTPVWRHDEDGCPISLMITRAGQKAIGVRETEAVEKTGGEKKHVGPKRTAARIAAASEPAAPRRARQQPPVAASRANSKQALIIGMLSKREGATIDALVKATGWLPHTTRAALTGLRKRGFEIFRTQSEKGGSIYRISASAAAATRA